MTWGMRDVTKFCLREDVFHIHYLFSYKRRDCVRLRLFQDIWSLAHPLLRFLPVRIFFVQRSFFMRVLCRSGLVCCRILFWEGLCCSEVFLFPRLFDHRGLTLEAFLMKMLSNMHWKNTPKLWRKWNMWYIRSCQSQAGVAGFRCGFSR